ncbi:Hypothetical predicted protein, partial [Scomber scombrus]
MAAGRGLCVDTSILLTYSSNLVGVDFLARRLLPADSAEGRSQEEKEQAGFIWMYGR